MASHVVALREYIQFQICFARNLGNPEAWQWSASSCRERLYISGSDNFQYRAFATCREVLGVGMQGIKSQTQNIVLPEFQ